MSRTFVCSALLLIAFAVPPASLRADEPVPPVPAKPVGPAASTAPDGNTSSGGTRVGNGGLQPGNNSSTTFSGVLSNGPAAPAQTISGSGTLILTGSNTYSGPAASNGSTLLGSGDVNAALGSANCYSGGTTVTGGVLTLTNGVTSFTGNVDYYVAALPAASRAFPPDERQLRRFPRARSSTSLPKGRAWATACGPCLAPATKR